MGIVRRVSALSALPLVIAAQAAPALAVATPAETIGGARLASHGVIVNATPGVPDVPKLNASSWVVADATTGQVLAAKDPHGRYLPASTLKTLTTITLIPKLSRTAEVKPTQAAVDVVGTKVGMSTKLSYKVEDLFRAMLLMSANDAAITVTQAAGGYKKTITAMNAEARRLQANDTLAASPNGLDVDLGLNLKTQHTSSYDLALFMKQGLSLPDFREYVGTVNAQFPSEPTAAQRKKGKKTATLPMYSHDRLLPGEPYAYAGMIGGKNGYTVHSEQTFVGAASRNGHTLIIALMHSPSLWQPATKLLDWGFAADGKVAPVGTLVDSLDAKKRSSASSAAPAAAAKPDMGDWPTTAAAVAAAALLAVLLYAALTALRRRETRPAPATPRTDGHPAQPAWPPADQRRPGPYDPPALTNWTPDRPGDAAPHGDDHPWFGHRPPHPDPHGQET